MPNLTRSERLILRASERRDLFEEKFDRVPEIETRIPNRGVMDIGAINENGALIGLGMLESENEDEETLENLQSRKKSTRSRASSMTSGSHGAGSLMAESEGNAVIVEKWTPVLPGDSPALPPLPPMHAGLQQTPPELISQSNSTPTIVNSGSPPNVFTSTLSGPLHQVQKSPPPLPSPSTSVSSIPRRPRLGSAASSARKLSDPRVSTMPKRRSSNLQKDTHFFDSNAWWNGLSIPMRIPLSEFEEEVGDVRFLSQLARNTSIS